MLPAPRSAIRLPHAHALEGRRAPRWQCLPGAAASRIARPAGAIAKTRSPVPASAASGRGAGFEDADRQRPRRFRSTLQEAGAGEPGDTAADDQYVIVRAPFTGAVPDQPGTPAGEAHGLPRQHALGPGDRVEQQQSQATQRPHIAGGRSKSRIRPSVNPTTLR